MTSARQDSSILMITPFDRNQRGNRITSQRLQSGLSQRGWDIDLLSMEPDNWQENIAETLHQKSYGLIHGLNLSYFTRLLQAFPAMARLPLLVTATGTDVNYDITVSKPSAINATLEKVKYIVIFDDYFRTVFDRLYPAQAAKLVTIPQGVYLKKGQSPGRGSLGLKESDFVFLLPSGLRSVKNLELAIDALAIAQTDFPHLRLLMIGAIIDQDYADAIIKRITPLPWAVYPGEFPHESMYGIMSACDIVLNTSHSEGQPQAALEAMSLGKPCLLTAVPGNLNLIAHGREGYYVRSQTDLAEAARKMMVDAALRRQMGENARRLVQQKYSWQAEIDAYEELYLKLLTAR